MKNTKYSCGMYGGSFNPLHLGHVRCMIQAASMCDRLIVVITNGIARNEIDINQRYRWVYETIRHFPNVSIFVLEDAGSTKHAMPESQWLADAQRVKDFAGEPIDVVFFGSDYGRNSVWERCYPEADTVMFPRDGISSTAIRQSPLEHWDDMPSYVRPYFVRKVLVLGTESTGKSTLTINLARYFNTTYLEEVGRDISQRSGTDRWMLPEDFTDILLQHKVRQLEQIKKANRVFFEDTNCFTTAFYLGYLDGRDRQRNAILAEAIAGLNEYDLVLLLKPNVAFVQDGNRSIRAQEDRDRCTEELRAACERHGITPVVIGDDTYHARLESAVMAVRRMLDEK